LRISFREWILTWEPDLTESIKWNMLCFFRAQAGVWPECLQTSSRSLLLSRDGTARSVRLFNEGGDHNTNIRSTRLTDLDGVIRQALRDLLHAAVELDTDPTVPPLPKVKRRPWPMPDFFKAALAEKRHHAAAEYFRSLAPTCQREYLVWLTMAKRPETRHRRLQDTLAALAAHRKWAQRRG